MWIILLGRTAQFLLMLATLRLATHFLTPAEMGKMAIMNTIVAFISSFLINPVGMYVNRQLHRWNDQALVAKYIGYHYGYIFCIAILSMGIAGLCNAFHALDFHMPNWFVMLFIFLTILFNTVNQTAIPSLNLLGFRGWFTVLSIATVLFGLLFAYVLVSYLKPLSEYWLLGVLMGQILFACIGAWVFYKKTQQGGLSTINISPAFSIANAKSVFQFSWPIAIAIGLTWFQSQSYRFFIEDTFGLPALGLFVAGYGISAGIMAGFESVFVTYFQPLFYQAVSKSTKDARAQAWNQYALVIIPSAILLTFTLAALSHKLTFLMLAPSFQSAAQFVVWGAFAEAFRVIMNVYTMIAHAEQNTKTLILPSFVGASICMFCLYVLPPIFGILGIAAALVIAGFVVILFLHLLLKKEISTHLPYHEMVSAALCGIFIWALCYGYEYLYPQALSVVCLQIFMVGTFFLFAEYYLLKIKGSYPWGKL